jgi:PAS domain S-box-containing protein
MAIRRYPWARRATTWALCLGAFVLPLTPEPSPGRTGEARRQLLILNSYDEAYPWTRLLVDTITAKLEAEFDNPDIYVEYMDKHRFTSAAHIKAIRGYLAGKFADRRFDLIVSTDDASLSFLIGQGPEFLGGSPVVFGGVSDGNLAGSADKNRFAGVLERFDYSWLVSLILRLRPATSRIVMVVDGSENAVGFEADLMSAIGVHPNVSAEVIRGAEIGLDRVLERLGRLPQSATVVSIGYVVDRGGAGIQQDVSMERIAKASPAPVFSPNVSKMGQGVLCGNTNGARQHASVVAGLAVRVLKGENPKNIPLVSDDRFGPVVDYAMLARWGISESVLPERVEVVNRPPAAPAPDRRWIIGLTAFLIVQAAIIALLVSANIARRKAVKQRDDQARELEKRNQELSGLNRSIMSEYAARESVEKALGESESRYRDLVENALDGIYTHDLRGRLTTVNWTICKWLGYSREELLKTNIDQVLVPESIECTKEMTARKLAGETPPPYELTAISKSGRRIWIEVSSRLLWSKGIPTGVEGIARDITSRKSLEEELRQARQMEALGRLSGGVAHDFNNILTVVTGYSDLLLMTLPADDDSRAKIGEIRRAGERASDLTRKLLAFGRAQASTNRAGDLHRTIAETREMLRYLIPPPVELVISIADGPAPVQCDPGELQRVLLNLSLNARDAMPEGGRIGIVTRLLDGQVSLTVSDTGQGMDETTRARAFDPFFTTKEPGQGTGLGLSTVYGIVRRAGGRIEIESSPGSGTLVAVHFPLADAHTEVQLQGPEPATPHGNKEIIFLVEDREEVRIYAAEVLLRLNYDPRPYESASSALDALDASARLLITDVVMPGMTGVELVRRAHLRFPALPVLYISGYTGAGQDAIEDETFLAKPFSPGQLAAAVNRALTPS